MTDLVEQADKLLHRSRELVEAAAAPLETLRTVVRSTTGVSVRRKSSNRKLSPQREVMAKNGRPRNTPVGPKVVATEVSIEATCPDTCEYKGNGCYGQTGIAAFHSDRLNLVRERGLEVNRLEALELDSLWPGGIPQDGARGGRDLRLHVSGDASCAEGARVLAASAARWRARGGGAVWTFTHRWQTIPRDAWGPISVLASCKPGEVRHAVARGYAPARVVPHFEHPRARHVEGTKMIPCPAEVGPRTCAQCRLCLNADRLERRGAGILFEFHGPGIAHKTRLRVIGSLG